MFLRCRREVISLPRFICCFIFPTCFMPQILKFPHPWFRAQLNWEEFCESLAACSDYKRRASLIKDREGLSFVVKSPADADLLLYVNLSFKNPQSAGPQIVIARREVRFILWKEKGNTTSKERTYPSTLKRGNNTNNSVNRPDLCFIFSVNFSFLIFSLFFFVFFFCWLLLTSLKTNTGGALFYPGVKKSRSRPLGGFCEQSVIVRLWNGERAPFHAEVDRWRGHRTSALIEKLWHTRLRTHSKESVFSLIDLF